VYVHARLLEDLRRSQASLADDAEGLSAFEKCYTQCVARINLEKILETLQVASADELGVYIMQQSFLFASEVVTNIIKGVKVTSSRLNTSGDEGLGHIDEIANHTEYLRYNDWENLATQRIDAVFLLETHNSNYKHPSRPWSNKWKKRIICYESDFNGNRRPRGFPGLRLATFHCEL